jgi:hypothetical protein
VGDSFNNARSARMVSSILDAIVLRLVVVTGVDDVDVVVVVVVVVTGVDDVVVVVVDDDDTDVVGIDVPLACAPMQNDRNLPIRPSLT